MADSIEILLDQFKQGLEARDRRLVNRSALGLIAQRAPLGRQWQAVAAALLHNGEVNAAIAAADLLVDALDGSAGARFVRATILARGRRLDAAQRELAALPATVPDPVANAFLHGTLSINLGDHSAAREALLRAIDLNPGLGQAWLSLAELVDFRHDPALARRLEEAWKQRPAAPLEQGTMGYAVGRARHQLGDHGGAFAAFSEAATALRQIRTEPASPLDSEGWASDWPAELIARVASRITVDHGRIIFVTGLPRSGSTLVEQILVSHPDVSGGEELGLFRMLLRDIGGLDAASFEGWLERGGDPNTLVETYLHLASERMGTSGRFVDKSLEASNYMGLLLALFPHAPLLWLRRDPIDSGWSAFRTYFSRSVDWSWDLVSVGRRVAREDRLFAHWTAAAGDRITAIDYEALVRDPDTHIAAIAAAAGLEPRPEMFAPHLTERTIMTASVTQVREPINLKGLGVAEPYRRFLGPMIEAYEAAKPVN